MEGEINNFMKAWFQAIISLCYCYVIGKNVPKGFPRLLAIVPIMCLFLVLPLSLNTIHLCGTFAFFFSWLANFKLALFAFEKGPLSDPSLSLKNFVVVASFPMKINNQMVPTDSENSPPKAMNNGHKSLLNYTIKVVAFIAVIKAYDYNKDYNMHNNMILYTLYSMHLYLILDIILAMVKVLARTLLGVELEPHFNEPYLASSLQDFWSRRWNLVVVNTLRQSIYEPTKEFALPIIGRKWASLPATFLTFLVSGLIHELLIYYLGRISPTGEITWFFLLHGFCIPIEVYLKKKLAVKFPLPRVVSGPLTLGFIMVTALWLFFPQLLRSNGEQKAFEEYTEVGMFLKNTTSALMLWFNAKKFY
ncbi:hypothetical protein Lal_00034638 [Lupinus albus]|uniref:Putative long-chain-alcohol O-fatty-acyltransferase n=1 Tax=Lupinus albus TaxID=3870 RepID=A0A6A5PGM9_LUPAL|nr:putative long-chain-alcohol O-fatty-acyltransferase [Lupinus albus]KAF1896937.1 hypothetical protein Lal_00034638 [Lupinus albus]